MRLLQKIAPAKTPLFPRFLQTQQAHSKKDDSHKKDRDIGYESHNTPLSFYH
jgi:hypothetical protein